MAGPDSVRFSPCLPEVARLEESTIPSGAARARSKSRATRHLTHPGHPWHRVDRPGPDRDRETGRLPPDGAPRRLGKHRTTPTDHRPEARNTAGDQGAPHARASPRTSPGASWSTIRGPLGPTSESARSKGGSRPTTAYPYPAPSGPSASPVPAHGDIRVSTVQSPVGPASTQAGSGSTSGATLRRARTARPALGGWSLAQNRPGGDSSSSSCSSSSSSSRSTSVSSM